VIGQTSYGKGSVQKLWPIEGGRAIKLTVSRYYTPKGRMIEGSGIVPDVMLPDTLRGVSSASPAADLPVVSTDADLDQAIAILLARLPAVSVSPVTGSAPPNVTDAP
jgi:C-terminal processing protease CtpA/Prc